MNKDERIAFRLSLKRRQQIEQLIAEGKFKNLSQAFREALKVFLEKFGDEQTASE